MKFKILPEVDGFTDAKGVQHKPGDIVDLPPSYDGEAWLERVKPAKKQKPMDQVKSTKKTSTPDKSSTPDKPSTPEKPTTVDKQKEEKPDPLGKKQKEKGKSES